MTSAMAEHEPLRHVLLVLLARRARRRDPSATVWTVVAYDPDTRVPIADIARQWQPAGAVPDAGATAGDTAGARGAVGAVPQPVARWVSTVLGQDVTISAPADDLGHSAWYLHTADEHVPSRRGGHGGPGRPTHPASRPDDHPDDHPDDRPARSAEGTA
jgi:hypothetical protein